MGRWLVLACLVVGVGSANAQSPAADLSSIQGAWEVIGVKLRPAQVQALQENDPEYIGAVLDISKGRMQWRPHQGGTLGDICDRPRLEGSRVRCAFGAFGPPDTTLTMSDGHLVLQWYDNANLILRRKR